MSLIVWFQHLTFPSREHSGSRDLYRVNHHGTDQPETRSKEGARRGIPTQRASTPYSDESEQERKDAERGQELVDSDQQLIVDRKLNPECLCIDAESKQAENGCRAEGHPDEGKSPKNTRLAGLLKPPGPTDRHRHQTTQNGKNKHAVVAPLQRVPQSGILVPASRKSKW
jgi:hypothetical protein